MEPMTTQSVRDELRDQTEEHERYATDVSKPGLPCLPYEILAQIRVARMNGADQDQLARNIARLVAWEARVREEENYD